MQPDPVVVPSPDGAEAVTSRDWMEPFMLALALGAGVLALLLAVVTRKHLLARHVAPADSPIEVV
jgi:hypothetical protein